MTERSVEHSTFVVERLIDATPSRVYAAFATAEGKARWFGQIGGMTLLKREFDFRVGGGEHLSGKWTDSIPAGPMKGVVSSFDARYIDIVPDARIIYAYDMHLDDRHISVSLATIEFKAEGAKTRFKITEQGAYLDGYDDGGKREHGTNLLTDLMVASVEDAAVKA
jgi:uncharacterized protein YndB with AHSA1/START domain